MYIWDVGNKDNEFGVLITNALHGFPRFLFTFAGKAEVGEKEKDNLFSPSLSHNRQSEEEPNWPLIGYMWGAKMGNDVSLIAEMEENNRTGFFSFFGAGVSGKGQMSMSSLIM